MRTKQFVVCGLGRFGTSIALTLADAGYEVMVIDRSEDKIQDISTIVTHAVQADSTDMEIMRSLGMRNFDVGIVAIGKDIQSSIMTTLLLKELGIPHVVAKATSNLHERVLQKIGADRIILPEQDMGIRIATNLIAGNILDYIQLSSDFSIVEVPILEDWRDRTIKDVDTRKKYGINIIAVQRKGQINISPTPDYVMKSGDILIVIGSNKKLQLLEGRRYAR
ncbi:MAG: potassium transporter Trk [Epulopiscium sp. Nele67-Bin005]|nr:MAG: potassium transporter Trk [Epulopiscium sp. Nele67-Bin005]